jgi:hypothetical protein
MPTRKKLKQLVDTIQKNDFLEKLYHLRKSKTKAIIRHEKRTTTTEALISKN